MHNIQGFEDLIVFQRAYKVSLELHRISLQMPNLSIATGSANEMRVWLRYALDLGYINKETWLHLKKEYLDIAKMRWDCTRAGNNTIHCLLYSTL